MISYWNYVYYFLRLINDAALFVKIDSTLFIPKTQTNIIKTEIVDYLEELNQLKNWNY